MNKVTKGIISAGLVTLLLSVNACSNNANINLIDQQQVLSQQTVQTQSADFAIQHRIYDIIEIRGINNVYKPKLVNLGIKNTYQLLVRAKTRKDRKELAAQTGISEKLILEWANHADLMRVDGIGPKFSNWLEDSGVDTIPELANRNAKNLYSSLEKNIFIDKTRTKKYVQRMMSLNDIQKWIDAAKATTPYVEITH